jgi:hypothetical protein
LEVIVRALKVSKKYNNRITGNGIEIVKKNKSFIVRLLPKINIYRPPYRTKKTAPESENPGG